MKISNDNACQKVQLIMLQPGYKTWVKYCCSVRISKLYRLGDQACPICEVK